MMRTVLVAMMAVLLSAGIARGAQEPVSVTPASPVKGGQVRKAKAMTAVGVVKSVAADRLTIDDGSGKDWTFVIGAKTKVIAKPHAEAVHVAPASPVEGGTVKPSTPGTRHEPIDVAPASPVDGGKVIPSTKSTVTDLKEGQRVQVTYHEVEGVMHATQVRAL